MFIYEMFVIILVLGAVIFLSYVATRFIGVKARKAMKGRYITIIETVSLGMDKRIHLVRVGEQYVLIASTGKSIEFLTDVKLDEYEEESGAEGGSVFDFKSIFDKYVQALRGNKADQSAKEPNTAETAAGSVFKSNLDRLKALTAIKSNQDMSDGDENANEK